MEIAMEYLKVFITGGIICSIGQILIDKTKITPARILTLFVVLGVILGFLGLYEPIYQFGKCGATVPISGFGYSLFNPCTSFKANNKIMYKNKNNTQNNIV